MNIYTHVLHTILYIMLIISVEIPMLILNSGLPPIISAIYVEWNKSSLDEPPGWDVVWEYFPARIEYSDHAIEILNLHSVRRELTRKGQKAYFPLSKAPSNFCLKKVCEASFKPKLCLSSPHTVKGFADDLTVISSSMADLSTALLEINKKAADFISLRPNKCFALLYDGKLNQELLMEGLTRNISEATLKILGHLLTVSPSQTGSASVKKFESKLLTAVGLRLIRGE